MRKWSGTLLRLLGGGRLFAAIILALSGLSASDVRAADVSVAVAANFTDAAKEIGAAFQKATGHKAVFSFGSTGQLLLADHLVLLERGWVLAAGPLFELEADPRLPLLRAPAAAVRIASVDEAYALTAVAVAGGVLIVPGIQGAPGETRRLRIIAADVSFSLTRPADTTILNCLPARILSITAQVNGAAQVNIVAGLGTDNAGARIVARITRKSLDALALAEGSAVFAQIKSVALLASGP